MAVTNTYTVNGGAPQAISGGVADIDMSTETGVKAGCKEIPVPLLNKITVTSTDTGLSKSTTIYAGYKIINQMLGTLVVNGNYNPSNPYLNTIITSGRFGIFEPGHYNSATGTWSVYNLSVDQIKSIINLGAGIKICVKIDYTKSSGSAATVYVDIPVISNRFNKVPETTIPPYTEIGTTYLTNAESVSYMSVESPSRRSWFESILTSNNLNVNLSNSIVDPKMTEAITITLMAYIGSIPTANNTFRIQPMNSDSITSVVVQFETYEPTINISNADTNNNPDEYGDGYGSVADYISGANNDTTINVRIIPPA